MKTKIHIDLASSTIIILIIFLLLFFFSVLGSLAQLPKDFISGLLALLLTSYIALEMISYKRVLQSNPANVEIVNERFGVIDMFQLKLTLLLISTMCLAGFSPLKSYMEEKELLQVKTAQQHEHVLIDVDQPSVVYESKSYSKALYSEPTNDVSLKLKLGLASHDRIKLVLSRGKFLCGTSDVPCVVGIRFDEDVSFTINFTPSPTAEHPDRLIALMPNTDFFTRNIESKKTVTITVPMTLDLSDKIDEIDVNNLVHYTFDLKKFSFEK